MPIEEYRTKFGEVNFRETPFSQRVPEGENWGQFVLRAATALDRIIREYEGKTIMIVCHGGVIGVSFLYFLVQVLCNTHRQVSRLITPLLRIGSGVHPAVGQPAGD